MTHNTLYRFELGPQPGGCSVPLNPLFPHTVAQFWHSGAHDARRSPGNPKGKPGAGPGRNGERLCQRIVLNPS